MYVGNIQARSPANGGTTVLSRLEKRLPGEPTTASEKEQSSPLLTTLSPPSPNPFNPRTRLRFTLSEAEHVDLTILDLRGRLVRRLADEMFSAGEHVLPWYGKDESGRDVGGGIYLVRFESGQLVQTQRLTLVR